MLEEEMFKDGRRPRTISEFRTFNAKNIKTFAKTNVEGRRMMKARFGRIEDKFFQLIPKALAFKPIDDIIAKGNFMAYECPSSEKGAMAKAIAPGLGLGVTPGLGLLKKLIDVYSQMHYMIDGKLVSSKTIVNYTTEAFNEAGIAQINEDIDYSYGCYIYAPEYFCPLDYHTGKLTLTEKSRTIHHYTASWKTKGEKRKAFILRLLGSQITNLLVYVKHKLNKL